MEENWEELKEQLIRVKYRIKILDMIEEKLIEMKTLSYKVIDEDLKDEEIKKINKELELLQGQIILLDKESTQLS